jgi:hypothetical protein
LVDRMAGLWALVYEWRARSIGIPAERMRSREPSDRKCPSS